MWQPTSSHSGIIPATALRAQNTADGTWNTSRRNRPTAYTTPQSPSRSLALFLFIFFSSFNSRGWPPSTLLCTHELWRLHGSTHEPPLQETEPWALLNPPLKQPHGEGTTLVVVARCGLQGPTMEVYLVTPRYTVPAASSVVLSPQYASCIPAVL